MPFYKLNWLLKLEEPDVRKDELQSRLSQKEQEIERLNKEVDRLLKDVGELEDSSEERENSLTGCEEELKALRLRDKLATEIIGLIDDSRVSRRMYDLVTDWQQAGMELSR